MMRLRGATAFAAVLLLLPAAGWAQERLVFAGRGDAAHDEFLKDLVRSRDFQLVTRDTVITRSDTVRGRLLVVGATLRLDGVILGDLVGVGANMFIRPSAHVVGDTRNIAGGLYRSALATLDGAIENEPNAAYAIERSDGVILIRGTEHRAPFFLEGIAGLSMPTYDRVNGVSLRLGGGVLLPRLGRAEPAIRGWGTYYSQRGDFGGGVQAEILRGGTALAAGADWKTSITNEDWIRGDLSNSLAFLAKGKDYRNYYAADRKYVEVSRIIERGVRTSSVTLRGQVEDASPLRAGTPWTVFSDTLRPNDYGEIIDGGEAATRVARLPAGRITSAIASINSKWSHATNAADITLLAEAGSLRPVAATSGDDERFNRVEIEGDWAFAALADHTVGFEWFFQAPIGTDSLPYQRWSYVGGSGTLPTFSVAQFPGDRIAYIETKYRIPFPERYRVPVLGRPGLELLHAAAMGWSQNIDRGLEQNVGLRLAFSFVYARLVTDPSDFGGEAKFSVGVTIPKKAYPWESGRR